MTTPSYCRCEKPSPVRSSQEGLYLDFCGVCRLPLQPEPSTVSQSVEGWEIQYSEIADRMFREFTDEVWRQKVAPYLREIKSLQSTTLSTLVKEMEGLKTNNHGEDESDYDRQDGFNAGISAAIEVVNRLKK